MIQMADIPSAWRARRLVDRDGIELRIGRYTKVCISQVELVQNNPSQLIDLVQSKLTQSYQDAVGFFV